MRPIVAFTNIFPLPRQETSLSDPAVAVLIFFRHRFWPLVGLIAGLVGNIPGRRHQRFWVLVHWDVGNGIMGLIPAWLC